MTTAGSTPDCPVAGEVKEFFAGRSVLVTGATGFMGKVLLEKLLRTCDRIQRVYILVRTKEDEEPQQRLNKILNAKLFEKLLKDWPDAVNKVVAVSGDVSSPSLGLCEKDEKMLVENVSVVFHLAATVRFDEPLKKALAINLGGTKRMLDLCRKMAALKVLVYVSSTYGHCQRREVDEVFYPSYANPSRFMEVIESMDDGLVASITPLLLNGRPNSYSLSKALTEQLLVEEAKDLPVAVVRPSIIGSCWREPIPGWTEGYHGPNGTVLAYSKGVLRCLVYDPKCSSDFVPVDAANNLAIAAAWFTAVRRPDKVMIYNCTQNEENKFTYGETWTRATMLQREQPIRPVWHPAMQTFTSVFFYRMYFYLTMLFPGYLVDAIAPLIGHKPIFVKVQKRILEITKLMNYYGNRDWHFINANMWKLWDAMDPRCKKDFNFNIRELDVATYTRDGHMGIKRFVAKEDPARIEDDRKHAFKMRIVHHSCQLGIAFVLCCLAAFVYFLF